MPEFRIERLEQFWFEELERAKAALFSGRTEPPGDVELPPTFWSGSWEDIVVENYLAEHLLSRFVKWSTIDSALAKADPEHVLGFHEGVSENLDGTARAARYRMYGDLITFFHGYLGNDRPVRSLSVIPRFHPDRPLSAVDNARYYYEAAGSLARKTRGHAGDTLERLAEVLPAYVVVLRGLPK